ncbi:MAG: DUF2878 domain-containing protein [Bacillota bacterium]
MNDNNSTYKAEQSSANKQGTGQIVSTLVFLLGVFACYFGAISGLLWIGPVAVVVIGAFRLRISSDLKKDLQVILLVGVIGIIVETLLILSRVYTPDPGKRILLVWPFLPEWILALWVNFSFRIKDILIFIRGRVWLSSIMGFVFGILIFLSASARGLLTMRYSYISLLIISIMWAAAVFLMFYYSESIYFVEDEKYEKK